ncbi:MAG: DEAD/DEAH box helicase [Bacteroidales bacterium]|nr:DEAD/DEAH box helicase [Bacteroidales bacterium]
MKFIVTIRNHRHFGYILIPYMVEESDNQAFYTVKESLAMENISTAPHLYTEYQTKIAQLAHHYSDTQIRKLFGGHKYQNNNDFLKQLTPEFIAENIRPSIDRKVEEILDICRTHGIKLYFKPENLNSIFPDDEVIISSRNAKAVFNFERTDSETRYYLSVSYKNKDISLLNRPMHVLSNTPCNIVMDKRLFHFDDIDAKKLTPFVAKEYVSVAKRVEEQYYQKFIKTAIASDSMVRASGFRIITDKATPKAILSVERDLTGDTIFCLKTRYNGIDFQLQSPNRIIVKFFENKGDYYFTKLTRDMQFETDAEEAAFRIFKNRIQPGCFKVTSSSADREMQSVMAINSLNANKELLTEAGIEIELSDTEKKYYTGKITLDISVTRNNDWFDVYAVIRLDDCELPFHSIKYYILNNIHEFTLPDGRIVVLPDEWFEKYRDVLASGTIDRKTGIITLKSYQYSALKSLPMDNDIQQKIKQLETNLAEISHLPDSQPANVNATLRPYQITAFNWLKMMRDYGFGAVLADDMGLGKTLCTLSLLQESRAVDSGVFQDGMFTFSKKIPSLLIVPKSLIYNWINEAHKFVPDIKILEFTGSNRADMVKSFPLYDLVIAGYGTLRNDAAILSNTRFNYIILDESQTVKNAASKTYQSLMMLDCNHRLALTGTPLENSLTDLWSQMNFINPGLLGNLPIFKKRFVTPIEKNSNEEVSAKLRQLIHPFILRRTKQQVLNDLPELMEQTILCNMTEAQNEIYEREKSKTRNSILDIMDKGVFEKSTVMVLQSLTKLRQIACCPSLVQEDEYTGGSGKTEAITGALQNIISQGHKVLIFSSFVKHLELISQRLQELDIDYALLTGNTEHRENEVKKFNGEDVPVFLISIKAGGTGLNLTSADYVFIIDPWWNPAVEDQAIARAHRMGQKNSVMVYRFISRGTVEEKIQRFQRKKADLASAFVSESAPFSPDLKDEVLRILE